jgi:hypothetical protein
MHSHSLAQPHTRTRRRHACTPALSPHQVRDEHAPRIAEVYAFTSAKKMSSVLVRHDESTLRLYNKVRCSAFVRPGGGGSGCCGGCGLSRWHVLGAGGVRLRRDNATLRLYNKVCGCVLVEAPWFGVRVQGCGKCNHGALHYVEHTLTQAHT